MAYPFLLIAGLVFLAVAVIAFFWPPILWLLILLVPLFLWGLRDLMQTRHAVLRNFPLLGTFRYALEMIRPEINQYFVESNTDGRPFSREQRSIVYQRAKLQLQTVPFGTQLDVYAPGYEWIDHSIAARKPAHAPRITIGGDQCTQPYEASLLNVSAMSYGSLSGASIRALNGGAKIDHFAHNTGEGSISDHHRQGGDLIWQIGTGYFGCRNHDGTFNIDGFTKRSTADEVKLIELKLSQGAKPGHGGILPAAKITDEIARIRDVPKGQDVLSPPGHSAFDSPRSLLEFIATLREASGGKPTGFKLCVGDQAEFLGICRAMVETGIRPDFITVDGGEGGTGAAPLEFSNRMGSPLIDGLVFVHNALVGFDLRRHIKIMASGGVITGFDMAVRLAAGADLCASARGFMLALGCIQARRCNSNHCPVGVATNNPKLERGLDVGDKKVRAGNWHAQTVHAFMELLGASGIDHPDDLRPHHIHRRLSAERVASYEEIYDWLETGELLDGESDRPDWAQWLARSRSDAFLPTPAARPARAG
ncbi:MAG: FMN-binding glutamate synthase family protein [Phycisphaerales bacterium]